jgi:hypothetical protein
MAVRDKLEKEMEAAIRSMQSAAAGRGVQLRARGFSTRAQRPGCTRRRKTISQLKKTQNLHVRKLIRWVEGEPPAPPRAVHCGRGRDDAS